MLVLDLHDERRSIRKLPYWTPLIDRVLLRVDLDGECWIFTGAHDSGGYGMIRYHGENHRCHVVTWEHENGKRPDGLVLDHKVCRRRECCNPAHLEAVTSSVNTHDRSFWKSNGLSRVTHCRRGHELTPENTYIRPDGLGRQCRACIKIRGQR